MSDASDDRGGERNGLTRRQLFRRSGVAIAALATATAMPDGAIAKTTEAPLPKVPTPGSTTAVLRVARTMLDPDGQGAVSGLTYNGQFPGPEIRVREGDLVRLQLENHLEDADTLTHWHGVLVPAAMDGVPNVSSAPLPPKRVLVYEYPIRQNGTYWYHSHFGLQEQIGLAGAFIIEPRDEPGRHDHDAVILLSDWTRQDPAGIVPALRAEGAKKPVMKMDGGGMAMKPDLSDVKYDAFLMNGKGNASPWALAAKAGQRVRLRLINAGASTYFDVSLDGHALEVIEADGQPVRAFVVDRILMGMGETYDVLVTLGGSGAYTLHAVAQDGSGQALGVIHTTDAAATPNREMPKPGPRALTYAQLESREETTLPTGEVREFKLTLGGDMRAYTWNISGELYPNAQPLVIRQGERVRVEIENQTMMFHPMHLHGHFFRLLQKDGPFAPLLHTASVAPKETLRFEFTADNPGNWIFHCHNLYHLEAGMGRVFDYEVSSTSNVDRKGSR